MLEFPQAIYRGNSVDIELTILNGNSNYTFQVDDVVKLGIKKYIGDTEYIIQKERTITQQGTTTQLHLTPEETANIPICTAILEVSLKYNGEADYRTVYQENIELKGVVNDE